MLKQLLELVFSKTPPPGTKDNLRLAIDAASREVRHASTRLVVTIADVLAENARLRQDQRSEDDPEK